MHTGNNKKSPKQFIDEKFLRRFTTFSDMSSEQIRAMIRSAKLRVFPAGRTLFRRDDNDPWMYLLLSGELALTSGRNTTRRVKAGTADASMPIAHRFPRLEEARSITQVTVLRLERDAVEFAAQPLVPADNYELSELNPSTDSDWISRYLCSINTSRIPPRNIQAVLMNAREVTAPRGARVVAENSNDQHYYIVKQGRAAVTRRTPKYGNVLLAELEVGSGFGEEALITRGTRNASVTMLDKGVLMRLPAREFLQLLVDPVVDLVTWSEAEELVRGGARFLDIRETRRDKPMLAGALHLPMSMLRSRIHSLQPDREYVIVCDQGSISPAASFLLTQHGIENHVLMGGVKDLPADAALVQGLPARTAPRRKAPGVPSDGAVAESEQQIDRLRHNFGARKRALIRARQDSPDKGDDELVQNDYSTDYL